MKTPKGLHATCCRREITRASIITEAVKLGKKKIAICLCRDSQWRDKSDKRSSAYRLLNGSKGSALWCQGRRRGKIRRRQESEGTTKEKKSI